MMLKRLVAILTWVALLSSCSSDLRVLGGVGEEPEMFPDYRDVTVPCNIAPLNFDVSGDGCWALRIVAEEKTFMFKAQDGKFRFGRRFWKSIMKDNAGDTLRFCLYNKTAGGWLECEPFNIAVSTEKADSWLAYRLIPPGYSLWKEMSINQRNIESFKEIPVYRNRQGRGNCVNCHSFRLNDPDRMLFHMRSDLAGTYVFKDGELEKLDTKTDSTMSALVYPYWHPSGNYVAFSVNKTNQVLRTHDPNRIEVFDEDSDVVIYDVRDHKILSGSVLRNKEFFETFPVFSPDGKSLYFCTAEAVSPMPAGFEDVRYSLCRVVFDPETCTVSSEADTLYNAVAEGGSVSFPKVSPDGRFLVFTLHGYGNFSIWHKDADLCCIDLETGRMTDMSALNSDDVESWHSWSSNGRWLVFSSRRDDGLYTRPYISHIDEDGKASKPFLLPQKDPGAAYGNGMYSYNIPEFITGRVKLGGREIADFAMENEGIKVKYENMR